MELLAPIGRISSRRMFGGAGLYADGMIVGLEVDGALYLKTDDQTRQAFADAGGHPFVYDGKGKPITMRYWTPPDEAMDAPDAMRPWAQRALDAALRSAVAKTSPPKKKAAAKKAATKKAAAKASEKFVAKERAIKTSTAVKAAPKKAALKKAASKKRNP